MSVSARHDLDADGQLLAPDERGRLRVLVVLDEATAHLPSVQHTAWMTLNELVRLDGVVREVGLACASDVPVVGRVVPLAPDAVEFGDALTGGCAEIGIVPVCRVDAAATGFDRILEIGPGEETRDLRVHGEGWWGGFSDGTLTSNDRANRSPIGPYIAASLVVGELFCSAAMRDYERTPQLFYSCWTLTPSARPPSDGPAIPPLELDALLAGVGAVGSMVIHALWALERVSGAVALCDADKKGVDETNMNRYVLFGRSAIGKQKASAAAEIAAGACITFVPMDVLVETVARFPPRIISAVDINGARAAIQGRYPARILSAATRDLRAELLRVGEPGKGACLRCFNPPEEQSDDDSLRAAVRRGEHGAVSELAEANQLTEDDVEEWVATGGCGRASDRLLPFLRGALELPPQFAISFVSSLAGIMLTAELLKDMFASGTPLDDGDVRAVFQFATPLARTNRPGPYRPDSTCPACGPQANTIAIETWRARATALAPSRPASSPDVGGTLNRQ